MTVDLKLVDSRLYQIGFLSSFLILGWVANGWSLPWVTLLTAIGVCLGSQYLWLRLMAADQPMTSGRSETIDHASFYSPMITALGLSLLLRVDSPLTMAIAALSAIAAKFLLRWQGKHLFNPANFGIVVALCLTQDAWVSPGQWGASLWLVGVFLMAGGLVLKQVGRWDTTVAFLGGYLGLEALRNIYLGWTWDVWAHRVMSGSLILFALFMITDPRTIPNSRVGRVMWALFIAALAFVLRNLFFVNTAVIWALFLAAPLTPLFDRVFAADRFTWDAKPDVAVELPALS